jgi:hypothetical protein
MYYLRPLNSLSKFSVMVSASLRPAAAIRRIYILFMLGAMMYITLRLVDARN